MYMYMYMYIYMYMYVCSSSIAAAHAAIHLSVAVKLQARPLESCVLVLYTTNTCQSQCVAVCCSVLLCVMLQCVALCYVAVCYSVMQCVAVRCSVLQCVAECLQSRRELIFLDTSSTRFRMPSRSSAAMSYLHMQREGEEES